MIVIIILLPSPLPSQIQILSALDHVNIVKLVEVVELKSDVVLVMELLVLLMLMLVVGVVVVVDVSCCCCYYCFC